MIHLHLILFFLVVVNTLDDAVVKTLDEVVVYRKTVPNPVTISRGPLKAPVNACLQAVQCTSSGEGNYTGCQPQRIRENRWYFIANSILIIVIGSSTNLLTLLAIPYAIIKYRTEFPWLWSSTTLLLLHLSLCDFLYCMMGIPVFTSIFYHGHLEGSASTCFYSAMFRNLIAYSDFLTMAAIALTRSIGLIGGLRSPRSTLRRGFTARYTLAGCGLIWLLAFLIISPATFSITLPGFSFGTFGWDMMAGKCEVVDCNNSQGIQPGGIIYIYGVITPLLVILVSYILLGLFVRREMKEITAGLGSEETQVSSRRVHLTLTLLSLAYALFTVPLVPVELGNLLDPYQAMVLYSWYWWMYAINVLIYVATSKDFRQIYKLFLVDLFGATVVPVKDSLMRLCGRSRKWELDQVELDQVQ